MSRYVCIFINFYCVIREFNKQINDCYCRSIKRLSPWKRKEQKHNLIILVNILSRDKKGKMQCVKCFCRGR